MKNSYQIFFTIVLVYIILGCKTVEVIEQKKNPVIKIPVKIETPKVEAPEEDITDFLFEYLQLKYKDRSFKTYLYVSVKHQKLYFIKNNFIIKEYIVSTATKGIGSKANSYKTPPGLHTIKRKIGDSVPYGGILSSRFYTGKIAKILTDKTKADGDYVTSRIMWLQGEELGINKGRNIDSYNRYIYIHGTAEEGFIGEPASHGCIRMKNKDVIELYDLVEEGIPVLILKY